MRPLACMPWVFALVLWVAPVAGPSARSESGIVYLEQNWSRGEREWWYSARQGSRMLPWAWARALELPGGRRKFLDPEYMAGLGYPANPASEDGLPIGFVVDQVAEDGLFRKLCRLVGLGCGQTVENTPHLGLTCSACHTAQLSYGGRTYEIEGAPTLADFQAMTDAMLAAMRETRRDPEKWARFSAAVGGDGPALATEFDRQLAWYDALDRKNGSAMRYGPGRLDAQGHILNKVSLIVGATDQVPGLPSDAPASYPFIWNVPQQGLIQWNGIVRNQKPIDIRGQKTDFGALGRNVGEVIGVFGEVDVRPAQARGYPSSIKVANLIEMERLLGKLWSPRWPAQFPPIDEPLRARGEAIYARLQCGECHAPLAPNDTATKVEVRMDPIERQGTDLWLACNTFLHRSKSGVMEGRKSATAPTVPIGAEADTRFLLENAVVGTILGKADEIASTIVDDTVFGGSRERAEAKAAIPEGAILPGVTDPAAHERARRCLGASNDLLRYKARPLNGIWATAPYLHNGSVPTLYDLLLPSTMRVVARGSDGAPAGTRTRPTSFPVGQREFDPRKVGYATAAAGARFTLETQTGDGVPILGNYNSGHDYGTDLPDDERYALVEYLKSL
ncbi:di-heme-cytochrome C peroxidase [Methylobacterium oryzae]